MNIGSATHIYTSYANLFRKIKDSKQNVNFENCSIPRFEEVVLNFLCQNAQKVFQTQPSTLILDPPIYVVGDLNGSLFDLLRIVAKSESFSHHRFLFLGNLIGQGGYSVETVSLLFALVTLSPRNVFVLRGNTEFEDTSRMFRFDEDLKSLGYSPFLNNAFQDAFNAMPVAAIIANKILATHGGIDQQITDINQIKSIHRPLNSRIDPIVNCILTPHDKIDEEFLIQFLQENRLKKLIHGGKPSHRGIEYLGKKRVAIFSQSNYHGAQNVAGLLLINGQLEARGYNPHYMLYPSRESVKFVDCVMVNKEKRVTSPTVFKQIVKGSQSGKIKPRRGISIQQPQRSLINPAPSLFSASMIAKKPLTYEEMEGNNESEFETAHSVHTFV